MSAWDRRWNRSSVEQLDDHLTQLAHHYSHSDNFEKAIEYLSRAGHQSLARSAHGEASTHFIAALNLLPKLTDNHTRLQLELRLQLQLGLAAFSLKGFSSTEAGLAFTRARELCEQLDDPPESFAVFLGLAGMHMIRAELCKAAELGEELLRRARTTNYPVQLMLAYRALGQIYYHKGDLISARRNLGSATGHFAFLRGPELIANGNDARIGCLSYLGWTLWSLGYPDQALTLLNETLTLAQSCPTRLILPPLGILLEQFTNVVESHLQSWKMRNSKYRYAPNMGSRCNWRSRLASVDGRG